MHEVIEMPGSSACESKLSAGLLEASDRWLYVGWVGDISGECGYGG